MKAETERQIPYAITYTLDLKYGTEEPFYETEMYSQKTDLWLPQGRRGLGVWGQQMQASIYRTDKQQDPAVQQREVYSKSCDEP